MPDPDEAVRLLRAIVVAHNRFLMENSRSATRALDQAIDAARTWLAQQPASEEAASCPMCALCKKPIKGKVYYQGGQLTHPVHKDCRIVIKRSKDGGI